MTRTLVVALATEGLQGTAESLAALAGADTDVAVVGVEGGPVSPFDDRVVPEGLRCWESPVKLGSVRALGTAFHLAVHERYDTLVVVVGAVQVPADLAARCAAVLHGTESIAGLAAWSSTTPLHPLPVPDAVRMTDRLVFCEVSTAIADHFGTAAIDLPVLESPLVALSVEAVRQVGPVDPVFQTVPGAIADWSLRARAHGLRVALAPSVVVAQGSCGVTDEQEVAVLDLRYPLRAQQRDAFEHSRLLRRAEPFIPDAVVRQRVAARGWSLGSDDASGRREDGAVFVRADPDRPGQVHVHALGFVQDLLLAGDDPVAELTTRWGVPPVSVESSTRKPARPTAAVDYPERVW
jgi:hypothetical protein